MLTTDPVIFGLFLRFLYQGRAPFDPQPNHPFGPGTVSLPQHNSSASQAPLIPPSIYAWILGVFLRAPTFQNYVLQYTRAALGRTIFLTPQLVSWIYTHIGHVGPNDALGRLTLDTLISYWAEPTMHVIKSAQMNNAWMKVFAEFPVLHREFLFGLQRKNMPLPQPYMVETPRKGLAGYGSPHKGMLGPGAILAAARAKKDPQQQAVHVPDLGFFKKSGGSSRSGNAKKDVPKLAIKQEEQAIPLSTMPLASDTPTNGRFPEPALSAARTLSQFRFATSAPMQHQENPGGITDLRKKRSASPSPVQNNSKLPKLFPKPAKVEDLDTEETEQNRSAATTAKSEFGDKEATAPEAYMNVQVETSAVTESEAKTVPK
jgi:hypothetical protein